MELTAKREFRCLSGTVLKLIAMACMLLDHMWATVIPGGLWMTCVGRVAFPIFAFQIAEGYSHTKNFKKYLLRMFLFALISEIPYNLMMSGSVFDPLAQNVMFTFCEALLLIRLIDRAKTKHWALGLVTTLLAAFFGYWVGTLTFVDYHGYGILMVLMFWLFRGIPGFWGWLVSLAAMIYINIFMMRGQVLQWGQALSFPVQGFAVLAMLPIGLYNGRRGNGGKAMQYMGYAFYPVHILILSLIGLLM